MSSEQRSAGNLQELREDLPELDRALAEALRGAFYVMGMSLRNYAAELHVNAGAVSRFLSGLRTPSGDFVGRAIELAGRRLSPDAAAALRRLHDRKGEEIANRPEGRVRTLTARVRQHADEAEKAARRQRETVAALQRAESANRSLRTQIQLSSGLLAEPSDAGLAELERYATLRAAGARDAVTCVSPDTHRRWCTVLRRHDRAPALTWTDTEPRTLERRLASYQRMDLGQLHRDALDGLVPLPGASEAPPGEDVVAVHTLTLDAMRANGPRPLARALSYWSEHSPTAEPHTFDAFDSSELTFRSQLESSSDMGPLPGMWQQALATWDHAERPDWTHTAPRTHQRRTMVYDLLALEPETRRLLTELAPVSFTDGPIVIDSAFTPWYSPAHQPGAPWYWPAYERYLTQIKGWAPDAAARVGASADQVVARLADPTGSSAYQTKGLVVGYVQSGKTANITGVVAKAVDAGYRLVIILSGSLNILRAQTQRRIDQEMVGRENILRNAPEEECEYAADPDWQAGEFLTHGGLPSRLGAFDVLRLTTLNSDYQPLRQGIAALEFEKANPALPLHHPANLHRTAARLMVVKKNKTVLSALVRDLRRLGTQLQEIPALIVDDESDHGSVNTAHPGRQREGPERSAINALLSRLLGMLPRAQYVAYTATPFANVLIDPHDSEDVFPKDFVLSLPRPAGYMGARDFHDIDSTIPPEERTVVNSQEKAHVRPIHDASDSESSLQGALDAFVLSGAIKMYREARDPSGVSYRHHTMLVHESVRIADHRELTHRLLRLWYEPDPSSATGLARLRQLHDCDFAPVSAHRADGLVFPASFDELIPYIAAARARITHGAENPVVVVNGDTDIERATVDFDRRPVWKILVGGAKLARGFTVEGLTVSYYRRAAAQADTLMQMGRWFGFRPGYADLVRLYISRGVATGHTDVDLYEAFRAMCRAEEDFRSQLSDYAHLVDGKPMVTPAQLPPLVAQHLPWLKPTSPSKMYNAELVEVRSPGCWIEPSAYPTSATAKRRNTERWRPVFGAFQGSLSTITPPADTTSSRGPGTFLAHATIVGHAQLTEVLAGLEWSPSDHFMPHLTYLQAADIEASIKDWLVLAPRLSSPRRWNGSVLGFPELSLFVRNRRHGSYFGRISDSGHRDTAQALRAELAGTADRRGIALLYPVLEGHEADDAAFLPNGAVDPTRISFTFALLPPGDPTTTRVHFRTKASSLPDRPDIDR